MSWWGCYGRECKLGWGWNESLNRLISVEREPRNITSGALNKWEYFFYNYSSTVLVHWVSFL